MRTSSSAAARLSGGAAAGVFCGVCGGWLAGLWRAEGGCRRVYGGKQAFGAIDSNGRVL